MDSCGHRPSRASTVQGDDDRQPAERRATTTHVGHGGGDQPQERQVAQVDGRFVQGMRAVDGIERRQQPGVQYTKNNTLVSAHAGALSSIVPPRKRQQQADDRPLRRAPSCLGIAGADPARRNPAPTPAPSASRRRARHRCGYGAPVVAWSCDCSEDRVAAASCAGRRHRGRRRRLRHQRVRPVQGVFVGGVTAPCGCQRPAARRTPPCAQPITGRPTDSARARCARRLRFARQLQDEVRRRVRAHSVVGSLRTSALVTPRRAASWSSSMYASRLRRAPFIHGFVDAAATQSGKQAQCISMAPSRVPRPGSSSSGPVPPSPDVRRPLPRAPGSGWGARGNAADAAFDHQQPVLRRARIVLQHVIADGARHADPRSRRPSPRCSATANSVHARS